MKNLRALLPLLVLAAGCGNKKKDEPPPAPYAGPLTVERIMGAKDVVKVFEPWDKALPKIEAKLGKATKVDAEKGHHKWAVVEGDRCAYIVFSSGDGKEYGKEGLIVDTVQEPMTVGKDAPIGNREECHEIAGKSAPADDKPAGDQPAEPTEGNAPADKPADEPAAGSGA